MTDNEIIVLQVLWALLCFGVAFVVFRALHRRFVRSISPGPVETARLDEIPKLAEALGINPINDTFVMFSVPGTTGADGEPVNVQFSVEDGRVGFDWLLKSDSNLKDRERFETFSANEGVSPIEMEMAGFDYLRVEMDDLAALGAFASTSLQTLYRLQPGSELEVFADAPSWRNRANKTTFADGKININS